MKKNYRKPLIQLWAEKENGLLDVGSSDDFMHKMIMIGEILCFGLIILSLLITFL